MKAVVVSQKSEDMTISFIFRLPTKLYLKTGIKLQYEKIL